MNNLTLENWKEWFKLKFLYYGQGGWRKKCDGYYDENEKFVEAPHLAYVTPEDLNEFIQTLLDLKEEEMKEAMNNAYWERNQLIALLSKIFPSWLGTHKDVDGEDWEDDWRTIVFIKIPTVRYNPSMSHISEDACYRTEWKQLSWHIHNGDKKYFTHLAEGSEEWDGHTTEEKYQRITKYKG